MLRHVALVRTDLSEECNLSIIRVTTIGVLGIRLAVTSNRHAAKKHWFLQEPRGITSQKTALLIVTAMRTSNLTQF
jgi:hypothetical protein